MAYTNSLSFASGYYHIDVDDKVTFKEGTPPEIIERFWDEWPKYRQEAISLQKRGIWKSRYHFFQNLEKDINKDQYKR